MNDSEAKLEDTPLKVLHLELGARLVPFAGYEMPVQYPAGIMAEHNHTRTRAGLFDVSHMGQLRLSGSGAAEALESLVPVDVLGLAPGLQRYALFTNDSGGILDDLMISNLGDQLFLVVNAACKARDLAHLARHLAGRCDLEALPERALLALQGPEARAVMARFSAAAAALTFMTAARVDLAGIDCLVTCSGYTGEDGFEISLPGDRAEELARQLLDQEEVAPIGLGARDSLRLEAGLCLYGHDMDETTTPVEASLAWAISKARRVGGARAGGFPGAEVVLDQLARGPGRRRVGIAPEGRAPVREGAELVDGSGAAVGRVTSGGFGPSLGAPVAMGYLPTALAEPGQALAALVRGRPQPVAVARLPFVTQRYFRG